MTTTGHEIAATPNTDQHIVEYSPLPTPAELCLDLPAGPGAQYTVARAREEVRAVLDGLDERLLVVIGPCSIHDPAAGLEYARALARVAARHRGELLVVMRTYFEKPRTTVGWKGLVNDPGLDGSHDMDTGLRTARRFLLDVTALGLPTATEFLEPVTPQYLGDLVAWGAIGARTAESQIHRQLVSGLSMPVGFKNGTDGGLQVALDACSASSCGQAFLGMDPRGRASMVRTAGNPDVHLVLRGGAAGPNYSAADIEAASRAAAAAGVNAHLVVDASHANSGKSHERQAIVLEELAAGIAAGQDMLAGIMAESFLVPGSQKITPGAPLVYGQSVTDACLGWAATETALGELAEAVRTRRAAR